LKTPAPSSQILIVDDEKDIRTLLKILFVREGYTVDTASGGKAAIKKIEKTFYPLIITDIRMPDLSGIELLRYVRENHPESIVILITAYASNETAVEGMKLGAYDYITKPFKIDEVKLIVKNALEHQYIKEENLKLKERLSISTENLGIVGTSKPMRHLMDLIVRISRTRTPILITGESGTGKDLVARCLHREQDPGGSFVELNCAAMDSLAESELFGHEKGAFTGAVSAHAGRFEIAHGGTLFFDEIGDMPLSVQVKLLRALQEHVIERVGSTQLINVDVRVITATHRNLEELIERDQFRRDLFYRINVVPIHIPPLRERREDIPVLAEAFLKKYSKEDHREVKGFDNDAMELLMRYNYPGNVRELENAVERAVLLTRSEYIAPKDLPDSIKRSINNFSGKFITLPVNGKMPEMVEQLEKHMLLSALKKCNGNQSRAANELGISEKSVRDRMKKWDIPTSRKRAV